jgi:hypothetical protein
MSDTEQPSSGPTLAGGNPSSPSDEATLRLAPDAAAQPPAAAAPGLLSPGQLLAERYAVLGTLGRVLWLEGQRSRALALASEAQVYYRQVGHQPRLASLSQWLSSRAPSPP